jgi:hypothetical protein
MKYRPTFIVVDGSIRQIRSGISMNFIQEKVGNWWGNLRERDHLEDAGVDGRIILR